MSQRSLVRTRELNVGVDICSPTGNNDDDDYLSIADLLSCGNQHSTRLKTR